MVEILGFKVNKSISKGTGLMPRRQTNGGAEVAPQETIEMDIDLSAPWIPGDGKLVKVHALGEWRAVWAKGKDEITDEELGAMSGPGVLRGPFRSVRDVEMEL